MPVIASLVLVLFQTAPASTPAPRPPSAQPPIVVLKDGTRYTLSKPYEVRGPQARLHLANGSLVAVRVSEIDVDATKRATSGPPPGPPSPARTPSPSVEVGNASPSASSTAPVGSRVKLDNEKASTLFRQDVIPTSTPPPTTTETPAAASAAPPKDDVNDPLKADREAEKRWRGREANRLSRLQEARESQREICARYTAALNSAGIQDGRVSDAAGAILGALRADCDTATRKVDGIVDEREELEEECRKTYGCQPGWLR